MKKFFAGSLTAFIFVLIFFVAYNVSFRTSKNEEVVVVDKSIESVDENNVNNKKITLLVQEEVFFPTINSSDSRINYFSKEGEFFSISFMGSLKKNSNRSAIGGIKNLAWSPEKAKALVQINNGNESYYALYDDKNGELKRYEEKMDYVAWSGYEDKILFKKFNSVDGSRSLIVADVDGKNGRNMADIPWRMISIASVRDKNEVFFWNLPKASEKTQLKKTRIIGKADKDNSENIGKETERYGADYLFSNKGDRILISSILENDKAGVELGVVNNNGEEYENMRLPTLVSKCVWSNDDMHIYCAVPAIIEPGMVIPDDYQAKRFFTKDAFWKINIQTGERSRLVELVDIEEDYDADKLFLSPAEDALFFTNRIDNRLYRINL
jgi:hypothetical protein